MKVYKMFMTVCMVIKLSVLSLNAKIAQTTQVANLKRRFPNALWDRKSKCRGFNTKRDGRNKG